MSNSFTDFFETLLPREITLYVVPGSLVLSITVWVTKFPLNEFFLENIGLRLPKSELIKRPELIEHIGVIDYIFFGVIWIGTTYLLGLIVGGIKQGLHENLEYLEKQIFNLINLKIKQRSKSSENLSQRDRGIYAMYFAIHEEKMYRREIERYGVFKEALENIAVSLIPVGIIITIWGNFAQINKIYGLMFLLVVALLLLAGANGYRELQKFRIKTMFEALEKKETQEKVKKLDDQKK